MVKLEGKCDLCDLVIEDTEMKFKDTIGREWCPQVKEAHLSVFHRGLVTFTILTSHTFISSSFLCMLSQESSILFHREEQVPVEIPQLLITTAKMQINQKPIN